MKYTPLFAVILMSVVFTFSVDLATSTNSEAIQREKLFQKFLVESEQRDKQYNLTKTNDQSYTNLMRLIFDGMVIHPSFGYRWDEVPAPTMTGPSAMLAVNEFVATNGWNMQKDGRPFSAFAPDESKVIRGLPWTAIHDRKFYAVTHDGILYVFFTGWHHNNRGVAYNPKTNAFARGFFAFKPVGQHWYVWATSDDSSKAPQQYEGTSTNAAEPNAPGNRPAPRP